MLWVWIAATVILAIAEAVTLDLTAIWFSLGSLAAVLAVSLGASIPIQIAVFLLVSIVLLLSTRPVLKRVLKIKNVATNFDRLIEQTGTVTEDIIPSENVGQIKIMGQIWSAKSETEIPKGSNVKVIKIEGVKAIVQKI